MNSLVAHGKQHGFPEQLESGYLNMEKSGAEREPVVCNVGFSAGTANCKLFVCDLCKKVFNVKEDLTFHLETHKSIVTVEKTKRRMDDSPTNSEQVHELERKMCNKSFSLRQSLNIHMPMSPV